jgi:hypothetical protein
MFRVDTTRPKEQKPFHSCQTSFTNHIRLDEKVLANEFGWIRGIGQDAANPSGSQEDVFRAFSCKKLPNRKLIGQVELGVRPQYKVCESKRS